MSDAHGLREIWGSVLMQVIHDAVKPDSSPEGQLAHRQALAYLNNPGPDFAMVCSLAGLDPVAVYQAWRAGRVTDPGQFHQRNPRRTRASQGGASPKTKGEPSKVAGANPAKGASAPICQHEPAARPAAGSQEAAE